jgi:hypothetical protein
MEGGKYGPVAVVDNEHTANEWIQAGNDNDWVPFELNDLSTTDLAAKSKTPFVPVTPKKRQQQTNESLQQTQKNLTEANRLMREYMKKKKIKSNAHRAGRQESIREHYNRKARMILQDYLMSLEDRDPEVYDFLDYLKTEFRANVPEDEYKILVDVLYAAYKEMFGPR